jgi:hypothetical protein
MENKVITVFLTLMVIIILFAVRELKQINNRLDRANTEYQFVVEDRDIIVYDGNRLVGRVKLEGQLDSLLVDDNQ